LTSKYKIKDVGLASQGQISIYLAESRMPTLMKIRSSFEKHKPLENISIGACLHVTRETAALIRTLSLGGASIALCASNPLSTQDDVAAALVKDNVSVYAWHGNDSEYYDCMRRVLDQKPNILIDDGADLIVLAHKERQKALPLVIGAQEETTTGVNRLQIMSSKKLLKIPIIAVNNAKTKMMFDNRYGTGQGIISVIKALNTLFAGKTAVIAGYGWCSRGMAMRAKGLGANVIVTEIDPIRALEAVMDGFRVMPMAKAIKEADIVFTATSCKDVLTRHHFIDMKDGAILANLGHFNVEISVEDLEKLSKKKVKINEYVEEYELPNGKRLYLLGEGRLANLVVLGGHPSEIMDLSFSIQALTAKYLTMNHANLENIVYDVPEEIDINVAAAKLETMNIQIDTLNNVQEAYVKSFEEGT